MHGGDMDGTAFMLQLHAQCIGEAATGELGRAIGRLQGNGAIGQCRTDLHDHAPVARAHMPQRCAGTMDRAQIGHLGDPAVFLGLHLADW